MENRCCGTQNLHDPCPNKPTPKLELLDGLAILLGPQSCWCARRFFVPGRSDEGIDDPAGDFEDVDFGMVKMNTDFLTRKLMRMAVEWEKVGDAYDTALCTESEKQKATEEKIKREKMREDVAQNDVAEFADFGVAEVLTTPPRELEDDGLGSSKELEVPDHNAKTAALVKVAAQYLAYRNACLGLKWKKMLAKHCKDTGKTMPNPYHPLHSYDLPVPMLLRLVDNMDRDGTKFGPFLSMAMHSAGSICRPSAESWSEAINSAGKRVLNESNSRMSPALAESMVILRMSNRYITHMQTCHPDACKYQLGPVKGQPVAVVVDDEDHTRDLEVEDPVLDLEEAIDERNASLAVVPMNILLN
jgi:hypothetical protein